MIQITPLIMAIIGKRGKIKAGNKGGFTAYFIIPQGASRAPCTYTGELNH